MSLTKIRRLNDGKIFSDAQGVALRLGFPVAQQVRFCCMNYLEFVFGEKYEWVYNCPDRGRRTHGTVRVAKVRTVEFMMTEVFPTWLEDCVNPKKPRTASELIEELYPYTVAAGNPMRWRPNSLSRHLLRWKDVYSTNLGMTAEQEYIGTLGNYIWKYSFDPDKFAPFFDPAIAKGQRTKKAIVYLNTGKVFKEFSQIEKELQISYYWVAHVCEGDVICHQNVQGLHMFKYYQEFRVLIQLPSLDKFLERYPNNSLAQDLRIHAEWSTFPEMAMLIRDSWIKGLVTEREMDELDEYMASLSGMPTEKLKDANSGS